jgi:hypothetical protein
MECKFYRYTTLVLLSNCFMPEQLMYSLVMDQLGPKHVGVYCFENINVNLWQLCAFVA